MHPAPPEDTQLQIPGFSIEMGRRLESINACIPDACDGNEGEAAESEGGGLLYATLCVAPQVAGHLELLE